MPTVILPNSVYLHVPKTGGHWTCATLYRTGLALGTLRDDAGVEHPTLNCVRRIFPARFTFGFVRHPFSWLRSYWAYYMRRNWKHGDRGFGGRPDPSSRFRELRAETFAGFVQHYLDRGPGDVGRMFELYTNATHGTPLDFVGRQENLRDHLRQALIDAGEIGISQTLDAPPPINVAGSSADFDTTCPIGLYQAVCQAERPFIDRWQYGDTAAWGTYCS